MSPTERFRRVDAVFDAVLDLPEVEQVGFVERVCGDDAELRVEVLQLLRASRVADGFLESPAMDFAAPLLDARAATAGRVSDRVGPFRLVREIGRGGMGTVYLAERVDGQFEQRVALKLIRHSAPGIVRRFLDERRILARLEHPSIARLIDGGIADGLPYFAMELVNGEPIDRYCTARGLRLEQRLDLFTRVCDAVGYAHQHLVIHRDLKPSNILVTADGQVKLLDFGIAKLLADGPGTADAARTDWVMTPEFAAPEQVRGEPVSTSTDVYSLGVLLYMLLTEARPYDVRGRTPAEVERIICSEDPPRPSARVPAPAARRLRGDLDLIVLTALRKEPEGRYASVQELAEDVRRFLVARPIRARRPTAGYRALRFAKRHAWGMAAVATIVLVLGAYAISMTIQHMRVERALADASVGALKAEQTLAFMLGLFEASERGQAFADTLTARALLNRGLQQARGLAQEPEVQAQMLDAVGHIHMQLGEFDAARAIFEESLATRRRVLNGQDADIATSLDNVAMAAHQRGDYGAAIRHRADALDIRRRTMGRAHPATLETTYWYAYGLHETGQADAARPLFEEWIAGVAQLPPEPTAKRATQYINLGSILQFHGDAAGAERFMRRGLDIRRQVFGDRHPAVARALSGVAGTLENGGRPEAAEPMYREALAMLRSLHPDGHPDVASAIRDLAILLHRSGRWDEAESLYQEQATIVRRFFGEEHMLYATTMEDLGLLLSRRGRHDRAEPYLREAVRRYRGSAGAESLLTRRAEVALGAALTATGRYEEAEPLLVAGFDAFSTRRVPGFGYAHRLAIESLITLYEAGGDPERATRYRALLSASDPPPATARRP